jgi:3-hydroxyacyl-CoA dehydrogenase/enoyl-CoA hydratase/3-hydroxybutyryl-CoA epimerase
MPMGPLELLDQVGLDVAAHIEKSMQPLMGTRYEAIPALQKMCERGWLGQKNGVGFYRYSGRKKQTNSELRCVLPDDIMSPFDFADFDTEVRDRFVLSMVNESAACLGEGLVANSQELDAAMVFGTGWAPHRGGPLHYSDHLGLSVVVRRLSELSTQYGPRFAPCAELRRRAETGESFFKSPAEVVQASLRAGDELRV